MKLPAILSRAFLLILLFTIVITCASRAQQAVTPETIVAVDPNDGTQAAPLIATQYDAAKNVTVVMAKVIYFRIGTYREMRGTEISNNVQLTFSYEFPGKEPKMPQAIKVAVSQFGEDAKEIQTLTLQSGDVKIQLPTKGELTKLDWTSISKAFAPLAIADFQTLSQSKELFLTLNDQAVRFHVTPQYMNRLTALQAALPKS